MMYSKMQDSKRNSSPWSRFLEMVRKADNRRTRSDLEFYTHSAVPALLTMQSGSRQEQL